VSNEVPRTRHLAIRFLEDCGVAYGDRTFLAPIGALVASIGEPMFTMLLLHIEGMLPEPFPEGLIDQVESLDELLLFADVKLSRDPM